MTIYLGHRAEDGREQLLLDHLTGVARYAQAFADSFGAGALAYQIGLAHDAGKYSDKFQRRIRGAAVQVDHSTAGAQLMIERRNAPAAYCIAGHHGGLPDGGGQYDQAQPTLSARKEKPVEPYDGFWREVTLEPAAFAPPTILGSGGFTASFWIRMLFSCLVDADYLDTEAFMQGKKPPRGDYASIEELLARLYRYMEKNFKNPKGDLNRERCAILQACMDAGRQQSPGLFTLTVPTGGGKTVSSLAFALEHAKRHHLKRVIYVIPFTSIIDQTVSGFEKILGKENVLAHHSGVEYEDGEGNDSDQSRKKLAAENWDMPVVVTTAVQFFESLFSNKTSRCRKLHNIAQSVIIFDEAQTIPLPYLKPCVRAIAELTVNYRTSCVLCTATQPALGPLFAEVLPALQSRELCPPLNYDVFRRVQYANLGKLCDEELASRLNGHTQVLCVVGLRKHAQTVFALLEQKGSVHLSTLMTPRHRRIMLRLIRRRLKRVGPAGWFPPASLKRGWTWTSRWFTGPKRGLTRKFRPPGAATGREAALWRKALSIFLRRRTPIPLICRTCSAALWKPPGMWFAAAESSTRPKPSSGILPSFISSAGLFWTKSRWYPGSRRPREVIPLPP